MFPNVRLMIVAVLASIMGIGCALALFAEFRVSHDSFLRASNATAPLQFGNNDALPTTVVNAAAPFEFRFQADPSPPAVVEAVTNRPAPGHEEDFGTPPALNAIGSPEPAAPPAIANGALTTAVAPASAALPAPAVSVPPISPVVASTPEPTAPPAATENAAEPRGLAAAAGSIVGTVVQSTPDRSGATADLATPVPAASLPIKEAKPNSKIAPEVRKVSEPHRNARTVRHRRPVVVRRSQRSRPAVPVQSLGQNFSAGQPAFQWTVQYGQQLPPQPARRVVIKRARPIRKPAATAATATPQTTAVAKSSAGGPAHQ
jgi:hypothetical protein